MSAMYTEVEISDAKIKLFDLLREVKHGHSFTITVRGRPIADLIPSEKIVQKDTQAAIQAMASIHKIKGVAEETPADWIKKGRW